MRLFDTRAGDLRDFRAGHTVRLYVCGITPYDSAHLGHAFTYVAFDALTRYLQLLGHRVISVRNVTDVDDDILRKARELGEDYLELGRREVEDFDRDLERLAVRRPDAVPLATETVPAMIVNIRALVSVGAAYALEDGRVYFDTTKSGRFGELSRLPRDRMLEEFAEKGGDLDAPGKRDPLDFLLWQPAVPGEPAWDSDWGPGRPGWHIECSVMIAEELGNVIDIHGGGRDLIFPHHSAEILQAEGVSGQAPFVRYWLHTGMVALDGTKMSKSLGNLVFVEDLLDRFEGGALRRYFLEHHYRADWTYDDDEATEAATKFKRWQEAAGSDVRQAHLHERFHAAMCDDLNTPGAIRVLDEAAETGAGRTLRELADILGFTLD
ncbi:MAG: cysteine--tRNA ligase [Nitriliruptorales bacterium]|nr:cysteine--tRNA ligase [Nitriliruptorales bacterium]